MSGRLPVRAIIAAAIAAGAAGCSVAPSGTSDNGNEYFSQAMFGLASPRVVASTGPVPRGGGTYKVGKPYEVAGTTYVPRDDPNYSAVGMASWYGSAFHGRLTANGEVYDASALTAAHPTLPLPSYARVTNLENGRSMVVRVNDRGPFTDDRIIDVSAAVADKLGFRINGTAEVKVDYVGPARLDGLDQPTLLASYSEPRQGWWRRSPQPASAPQPGANVVLASAPAPRPSPARLPDEAFRPTPASAAAVLPAAFTPSGDPLAALIGPPLLSYAGAGMPNDAQQAVVDLGGDHLGAALARAAALKGQEIGGPPVVVQVGSFSDRTNAVRASVGFDRFGPVEIVTTEHNGRPLYVIEVASADPQAVVAAAMDAGLPGAIIRR